MQFRKIFILLPFTFLMIFANHIFGQEIKNNYKGERIIVYKDGSWRYFNENDPKDQALWEAQMKVKNQASTKKRKKSKLSKQSSFSKKKTNKNDTNEDFNFSTSSMSRKDAIRFAEKIAREEDEAIKKQEDASLDLFFLEEDLDALLHQKHYSKTKEQELRKKIKEAQRIEKNAKNARKKIAKKAIIAGKMIDMDPQERAKTYAKLQKEKTGTKIKAPKKTRIAKAKKSKNNSAKNSKKIKSNKKNTRIAKADKPKNKKNKSGKKLKKAKNKDTIASAKNTKRKNKKAKKEKSSKMDKRLAKAIKKKNKRAKRKNHNKKNSRLAKAAKKKKKKARKNKDLAVNVKKSKRRKKNKSAKKTLPYSKAISYSPPRDVMRNPPPSKCNIAFEGVDEFTGKNRRDIAPEVLFTYTSDRLKSFLKDKDFITCYAGLSQIYGKHRFINFEFIIASLNAQREFGMLEKSARIIIYLIDGTSIESKNLRTDTGTINNVNKTVTYKAQCLLSSEQAKAMRKIEVDKIR
ncbi:MAG TPA: hypothetical protein ENK52_00490, partial [Saprospiraceae bacterium]|nr:hypothetical protein [Saprospiraceae bacterium]